MLLPLLFSLSLPLAQGAVLEGSVTDYAPRVNVPCPPSATLFREFTPENQTIHPQEVAYIAEREIIVREAWKDWWGTGGETGYSLESFQRFPRVGIAIPGGGLRAAQYAAFALNALDARNESSRAAGTGGLLQVTSYMTGLSGGSWITGSLMLNNFPTMKDLVFGNEKDLHGWLLDLGFVSPDGINLFTDENQAFFGSLLWSVGAKANAGIDTSITDTWARMISYHFLNQTTRKNFFTNDSAHGAGQLWSQIALVPAYRSHLVPFPIAVANSRPVGSNLTTALTLDPVVYEISPLEFGSYDPMLSAMMNTSYAGTHLVHGEPFNNTCVTHFDQAGFVMGTSASLFNQIFDFAQNTLQGFDEPEAQGLIYMLDRQLRSVRTRADDVANWPSPFTAVKNTTFKDSQAMWLELIDGSANSENVPYGPLFVRARGLDTIVTLEGSADDPNNWPNGSAPLTTAERIRTLLSSSHQRFPPIPESPEEFVNTGVNARATFFGCNPEHNPPEYPMVIYLPNAPPINGDPPVSNSPTFQLRYTLKHTTMMFDQIYKNVVSGFTPRSNDPDSEFGLCLKCATIDRARYLSPLSSTSNDISTPTIPRSDKCTQCLKRYCYDSANPPSVNDLPPNRTQAFFDPDPQGFSRISGFIIKNQALLFGGGFGGLGALMLGLIVFLIYWQKKREKDWQYELANLKEDEEQELVERDSA